MIDAVLEVLVEAVRVHAEGGEKADAEIRKSFSRSIPATVAAVCTACKKGSWTKPVEKSRQAKMARRRLAALDVGAPPEKPSK